MTHRIPVPFTPEREDRMAIHAKHHKQSMAKMSAIALDEWLDAQDLLDAKKKEGDKS